MTEWDISWEYDGLFFDSVRVPDYELFDKIRDMIVFGDVRTLTIRASND